MTIAFICIGMATIGYIAFLIATDDLGPEEQAVEDRLDYGSDLHTARLVQAIRDVEDADDRFLNSPFHVVENSRGR